MSFYNQESFRFHVLEENKDCVSKTEKAGILHFVVCAWISPINTFECRKGYFDDYFEASEYCRNLKEYYSDFEKIAIIFDGKTVEYRWKDDISEVPVS